MVEKFEAKLFLNEKFLLYHRLLRPSDQLPPLQQLRTPRRPHQGHGKPLPQRLGPGGGCGRHHELRQHALAGSLHRPAPAGPDYQSTGQQYGPPQHRPDYPAG